VLTANAINWIVRSASQDQLWRESRMLPPRRSGVQLVAPVVWLTTVDDHDGPLGLGPGRQDAAVSDLRRLVY